MENREALKEKVKKETKGGRSKIKKSVIVRECLSAAVFFLLAILLSSRDMAFEAQPTVFALLAASGRQAPFILIGIIASAFFEKEISLMRIAGACIIVALRIVNRLYIDKEEKRAKADFVGTDIFAELFSEHAYLRIMSAALGVFAIGVWRIIKGGFRFYDLFASVFYLVLTPIATWLFSNYFDVTERKRREGRAFSITVARERLYDISKLSIACAVVFSLDGMSFLGISIPVFFAVFSTLYASKKGILYGILAGLLIGVCYAPAHAPAFAFCAVAYVSISKLSLFGGAIASCISGVIWAVYTGGVMALATAFPAFFASSMMFCAAERIDVFEDVKTFLESEKSSKDSYSAESVIAAQKINSQNERIRSISESFASLSEIFYNLSSRLKRPTVLDLSNICEKSFEKHCADCDNRELCLGAEYGSTLDVIKGITLQLHSLGTADESKLPEEFRKKCPNLKQLSEDINKSCAIATKKAFLNEKTEIFALDYDSVSRILNDAISDGDEEFKINDAMGKKISRVIAEEGYGEHSVVVFGRRKMRIFARGLDLSDKSSDVSSLKKRLEEVARISLTDPKFELTFGSVNMQLEARRVFSAEASFSTAARDGESVCGDTVSIFENRDGYLYALISDGMGTGSKAAATSEICNSFLRNMLTVGNKMETSLRMLNSVLRVKGSKSEAECSATIDLMQFDLYSGALSLVKSGASPTFVVRRGNVFKLASPSFPIGILRALDAKQTDISCEDGDVIVMVSDGAVRDGDDCSYLVEMLRDTELIGERANKIADKLIRRVRSEVDLPSDDISVAVVKVKKEIRNW